jgi:transposase
METFDLDTTGLQSFFSTVSKENTYVLIEATITTFSFARLLADKVKEVIIANTYELKQISMARTNTDKIDADKLCRIIKMQVLSGERLVSPVTLAPKEIQDLRALFTSYRLLKKQRVQLKNRIHRTKGPPLLKEQLHGFTQEEIFTGKGRAQIHAVVQDTVLKYQVELFFEMLDRLDVDIESLKKQVQLTASPFIQEIDILTSMKGISVFSDFQSAAIAIIADIIDVSRFKDSKAFTSYLRSAPHVANSNTSTSIRGTNKKGRKLSATLLTQSLNHVLDSSLKLRKWYDRLTEYKKAGLVRTGLRPPLRKQDLGVC